MTETIAIVHEADPPEEANVVIALCGESGFILDDFSLTPKSFDYAFPGSPYIDCEQCLAAGAIKRRLAAQRKVSA
jgi:hypothetical protein